MIHFFRRIRQTLLRDNKFSKYLLYAIGEILLVVVGILIALQINNWNQNQQQRKLAESILIEMKENLKSDLGDIKRNIKFDSIYRVATFKVVHHLEKNIPLDDTIKESYGKLGWASLFAENTSAFENLKALGFNLITNEELRGQITYLYSTRYEYANEIFNKNSNFLFDNFHPVLIQHTSSKTGDYFDRMPNNYQELSKNPSFKEILRLDLFMKKFSINLNRKLEKEVQELINSIDREISQ